MFVVVGAEGAEGRRQLWVQLVSALPVLADRGGGGGGAGGGSGALEWERTRDTLVRLGLAARVRDMTLEALERLLRRHTAPEFWQCFAGPGEGRGAEEGFRRFACAVSALHRQVSLLLEQVRRAAELQDAGGDEPVPYGERDLQAGFLRLVRATLLSRLPLHARDIIDDFYTVSFDLMDSETDELDMSEETSDVPRCARCRRESPACRCERIDRYFRATNAKLTELGLLERLTGQALTSFIQKRIERHVLKMCKGTFYSSHVASLESWLDTTVMSWLTRIYCNSSDPSRDDPGVGDAISKFKQKLSYYLYEFYTKLRIDQLFDIIIDYPDTQPAIDDIKLCLEKTDLRAVLSNKLKTALETRLLHPGVNTPDILTAYIAAIRALQHLDPSGVLLETVTKPVRQYLRTRDDTVRSVVSSLTEDAASSELAEELAKFVTDGGDGAEGEPETNWSEWNPDPVGADHNICAKGHRTNDIISMLVNVYGSKELFVNEYRTLLADRLLAQSVINTEKEIRYLELLKIRFGESQLHFCEVMLKDISDSKRINGLIQHDPNYSAGLNKDFTSNAMILSAQFWPPFKDETLELPDVIKQQLEAYTQSFQALKGNRTLNWKPHLGNVNIEIEIDDKKLDLTVSPFNATLIMHFQTKPEWDLEELHQVMKVPTTVLRRKITFWQSMGLISEKETDLYVLVEGDCNKSQVNQNSQIQEMVCEDDETESAMASAHDQREGELQVFWSYIVGMLTNLDSLPLDRIHQMLKMFASQAPGTECSLQELRQFLDTKVRSHQLVLQGGMYKLPKN